MESNPLFPSIVSDYKELLRANDHSPISLARYCRQRHVHYKSVTQWMSRRGLHLRDLRTQVLIEKYGHLPSEESLLSDSPSVKITPIDMLGDLSAPQTLPWTPPLTGLTLTFPDGMIICIKESSAESLSKFIECYNKTARPCLP